MEQLQILDYSELSAQLANERKKQRGKSLRARYLDEVTQRQASLMLESAQRTANPRTAEIAELDERLAQSLAGG